MDFLWIYRGVNWIQFWSISIPDIHLFQDLKLQEKESCLIINIVLIELGRKIIWIFSRPAEDIVLLLQNVQCKVKNTKDDGKKHNTYCL